MKQFLVFCCLAIGFLTYSQENTKNYTYLQTEYFYGNILKHNKNVGHFLVDHPTGFILSYNKKLIGKKDWEKRYNYPDYGLSFSYQDYKNPILGKTYSVYVHNNFYLLERQKKNQIILRAGLGAAYNTNPYDKVTNPKNVAFGTKINAAVYLKLYYQRENVFNRIGVNAGLSLLHASNASFKAPNTGLNVWAATIGLNYKLTNENELQFIPLEKEEGKKVNHKLNYNFEFRFGANESEFIGSGIKPFFVLAAYADKRINKKTALQFGSELMVNYTLKKYNEISAITSSSFKKGDFKRVGVFIGHELFFNKTSFILQVGYYVYYPFEFEGRLYERFGLKHYFNKKWFASINLKAHIFKAETVSLGIGIKI